MILSEKFEKMGELDESSDRAYLIDQIRAWGKNYDFSHFTTQQLWNILNKLQKQNDDNLDMYNDAVDAVNKSEKPVCDKCGMELNDNGECPLCDLNDESSLDENKLDKDYFYKCSVNGKYYISAKASKIKSLNPDEDNVWILSWDSKTFKDLMSGKALYKQNKDGSVEAAKSYVSKFPSMTLLESAKVNNYKESVDFSNKILYNNSMKNKKLNEKQIKTSSNTNKVEGIKKEAEDIVNDLYKDHYDIMKELE